MFTGIVQGLGEIISVQSGGQECRFCVKPLFSMENIEDGESMAINGACLSVEKHDAASFTVYASAETMSRTNLGGLRQGMLVNLERALAVGQRLGGHIVSGHVDCLATVSAVSARGQSLRCRLRFPGEYGPQVIAKGSVALDGISLTINSRGFDFLEVNVIPDSQLRTNIRSWRPGAKINMETDIIGKYVQSLLGAWASGGGEKSPPAGGDPAGCGIDMEFLSRNGFA